MNRKEFFKPTNGKLVLPVLVLLFFLIILFMNYHYVQKTGRVMCEVNKNYFVPFLKARMANDTETAQKLVNQGSEYVSQQQVSETTKFFLENSNNFLEQLSFFNIHPSLSFEYDDFYPYTYLKKEDFECLKASNKEMSILRNDSYIPIQPDFYDQFEYHPIPLHYILIDLLSLIIGAYLLSCIAALFYKKIRKKP